MLYEAFQYSNEIGQEKNFGSGQLIFENWSGGPLEVFLNHNLNFSNLINVNMQTLLPMHRWQPGGVRCWADLRRSRHGES